MALGAGRERAEDLIDPAVGVVVLTKPGDCAKAGDPILELHYRDASRLDAALAVLRNACRVENEALPSKALILETVV
jgi:thymidine phosphorylase